MPVQKDNPPSFFIVPDEKRSYESSLKLGNVIYQVKRPHMVLFCPDEATPVLTVRDIVKPKTLKNYHIGKDENRGNKVGLFAKILEFFSFGAEVSHTSDKVTSETYSIESMSIDLLDPSPEFLAELGAKNSIMDILKNGAPPCAFLVTGVVTASGISFKSTDAQDRANEASLGLDVHGAPLGLLGKRSRKRTLKLNWEDPGPTVLAFSVQKLQLKDGTVTAAEEIEGAYFGEDDEPRNYEVDFNASLDQHDVAGLVPEPGEDQFVGGVFRLYLPNE